MYSWDDIQAVSLPPVRMVWLMDLESGHHLASIAECEDGSWQVLSLDKPYCSKEEAQAAVEAACGIDHSEVWDG